MIDWFVGPMDRLVGPLAGRLVGGFAHVGLITDLHLLDLDILSGNI